MECISIFDMLKISVGPSSSHTLGPWRAAEQYLSELDATNSIDLLESLTVNLYGSLSLTGKGHATDKAVMLGLSAKDPETISSQDLKETLESIETTKQLLVRGEHSIDFDPQTNIVFRNKFLNYHPNGIRFIAKLKNGDEFIKTYYSIGGGFIIEKGDKKTVEIDTKADDEINTGLSASYTMGSISMYGGFNKLENKGGSTSAADVEASIFNISFAF